MNSSLLGLALCLALTATAHAADEPESAPAAQPADAEKAAAAAVAASAPTDAEIYGNRPADFGSFCLFSAPPSAGNPYTTLRKLKVARQTYGSVRDVLPELVDRARALGAGAIVDYNGSQRFGFWPWRLVRPVATGTAIKWNIGAPADCKAAGGMTVAEVLNSNKPPSR